MAYTDAATIAAYLGRSLTAGQQAQATSLASAASTFVDRYTGRTFGQASPVANELHTIGADERVIYLRHTPVVAISSITARVLRVGGATRTLVDGTDYELLDANAGAVTLWPAWIGDERLISVTYTHTEAAPDDVQQATTMLAAHWLSTSLHPEQAWLSAFDDYQTLRIALRDPAIIPPAVTAMLTARRAIVFA